MLLIINAKVFSPEYLGEKDILIAGEQIEWIKEPLNETQKEALEASGARIIDAKGKYVFPGLIDRHVHITGGGGEGGFRTKAPEVRFSEFVQAGITTVVGLLGTDGISRSVENLLAKAKALNEEGITVYTCTGSYGYPSITITGDAAKDIAFIQEMIGVKLALSDHRATNISEQELTELAGNVRTAGMIGGKAGIVVLHMGDDERGLKPIFHILRNTSIPIKTFQPTHVGRNPWLFEQAMEFAQLGGTIDFTADEPENTSKENSDSLFPALYRKMKERKLPMNRVTLSSDGQGSYSKYNSDGMLTGIGISSVSNLTVQIQSMLASLSDQGSRKENEAEEPADPKAIEEILSLATVNPAKVLEVYPKKGCICTGSDADLILVNRDSFEIEDVVARGRLLMSGKELLVKGTFE